MSLASCDDHGFDFDKARSENVEYQYDQNFQKLFGNIDANQSWDFSEGTTEQLAAFTLVDGTEINVGDRFSSVSTRGAGDFVNPTTTTDWYYIPANTLSWFKKYWTDGIDHRNFGTPFAMYVPGGQCSITPFFQGGAGDSWYLNIYFQVPTEGTTEVTTYSKTAVWNKGEIIQKGTLGNYTNSAKGNVVTLNGVKYTVTANNNGVLTLTSTNGTLTTYSNGDVVAGSNLYNVVARSGGGYKYATYGSWANVGTGDTETAAAVRSHTLHFTNIPKGTVVFFGLYNKTKKYDNVNFEALSVADQMRAVTLPTEAIPDNYPIDFGEYNHPVIIGCEDRRLADSDKDYNDIVFFVNGLKAVETTNNTIPRTVRKRYMVEDMGYSDKNSQAVANGYTDIDFNDIVIDFEKTENWKINYRNGVKESEELLNTTYEAKVLALGGTWDFKLFVGNNCVFQKSNANNYINYNTNYKINNVAISAIDASKIYNTTENTQMRSDGNFDYTTFIGTLKSTAINNWVPDENNISFEIIDNGVVGVDYGQGIKNELNSTNDTKNVYTITWPDMGATPKIVAFPTTKKWQQERNPVEKTWFSSEN